MDAIHPPGVSSQEDKTRQGSLIQCVVQANNSCIPLAKAGGVLVKVNAGGVNRGKVESPGAIERPLGGFIYRVLTSQWCSAKRPPVLQISKSTVVFWALTVLYRH